jgi:hypothetical protein
MVNVEAVRDYRGVKSDAMLMRIHPTRVLRMIIQETALVPDSFPLAIFSADLWGGRHAKNITTNRLALCGSLVLAQ